MLFHSKNGREAELEIREAFGPDFDGIIGCMHAVFEGSYLNPDVFKPGYLQNRTKTEDYRLFVAAAPDGVIAAQIGLYAHPWFPGCRELCMLAVRPEYRGFGLSRTLIGMLTQLSETLGSTMSFSTVATHLNFSQSEIEQHGFHPCGFWFSEFDEKKQAVAFNHATCKLTSAVYVKPASFDERIVYVPPDLKPLAGQVYGSLGLPVQISSEPSALPPVSSLAVYRNEYHRTCYIIVDRCGADLRAEMEAQLRPFENPPAYTLILMLNIGHPAALDGLRVLQRLRFEFAGFFPASPGREYMILSRRGAEPFAAHELKLSNAARELLDEVLNLQNRGRLVNG